MHIGQQTVLEIHGIRPSLVREKAVAADAEELGIGILELREVIGQALILPLTDRTPVQGVKTENHVLLAAVLAELDVLLVLILEIEVGGGIAHFDFRGYVTHHFSSFGVKAAFRPG